MLYGTTTVCTLAATARTSTAQLISLRIGRPICVSSGRAGASLYDGGRVPGLTEKQPRISRYAVTLSHCIALQQAAAQSPMVSVGVRRLGRWASGSRCACRMVAVAGCSALVVAMSPAMSMGPD